MDDFLTVEKERTGEVGIITASGDVDMSTMRPLREAIRDIAADGAIHLILDLRKVDYMDSSGMSVIMTAKKLAAEQNGKVFLVTRSGNASHALQLVKDYHMVELADTPEDALNALGVNP